MNKRKSHILLAICILACITNTALAQVSIGLGTAPTYGALLDLKTQQAGTVNGVGEDSNITSTKGGLLLPRVKIASFASLNSVVENGDNLTVEDKLKLAGLMVYNINAIPNTIYLGLHVWNGTVWTYMKDNKVASAMTVGQQPKEFSFYETGAETTEELTFIVNPPKAADGTAGSVTYKWYQLIGNNIHATVGAAVGTSGTVNGTGAATNIFTPTGVIKGTTRNANNTGFYRFYCVANGSDGSVLRSEIAQVAVGCGAKDNFGNWITFMCFNLGADNDNTIQSQIDYPIGTIVNDPITTVHTYIPGEENLWGDMYQWGRTPDGHEDRQSENVLSSSISTSDIVNGKSCTYADAARPFQQVNKASAAYKKFIKGSSNWTPVAGTSDQLWRSGRFLANDPCAHYKIDGSFQEFWHEGVDQQSRPNMSSPVGPGNETYAACSDANMGWRTPAQDEWGSIYKSGTVSGTPNTAMANTWHWNNTNGRGYEIRPDGQITTLFLPATGYRGINGYLHLQGTFSYYWSTTITGTDAYALTFGSASIGPATRSSRANGFALRCIKH